MDEATDSSHRVIQVRAAIDRARRQWHAELKAYLGELQAPANITAQPASKWRGWAHRVAGTAAVLDFSHVSDAARHLEAQCRPSTDAHVLGAALAGLRAAVEAVEFDPS